MFWVDANLEKTNSLFPIFIMLFEPESSICPKSETPLNGKRERFPFGVIVKISQPWFNTIFYTQNKFKTQKYYSFSSSWKYLQRIPKKNTSNQKNMSLVFSATPKFCRSKFHKTQFRQIRGPIWKYSANNLL